MANVRLRAISWSSLVLTLVPHGWYRGGRSAAPVGLYATAMRCGQDISDCLLLYRFHKNVVILACYIFYYLGLFHTPLSGYSPKVSGLTVLFLLL